MKFDELYKNYYKNVLILIQHHFKTNNDTIMDISQIFWMNVYKNNCTFKNKKHFMTFAYKVTKNISISYFRTNKKHLDVVDINDIHSQIHDEINSGDQMIKDIEFNDRITKIRKTMSQNQRTILDCFLSGHEKLNVQKITKNSQFIVRKTLEYAAKKVQEIC